MLKNKKDGSTLIVVITIMLIFMFLIMNNLLQKNSLDISVNKINQDLQLDLINISALSYLNGLHKIHGGNLKFANDTLVKDIDGSKSMKFEIDLDVIDNYVSIRSSLKKNAISQELNNRYRLYQNLGVHPAILLTNKNANILMGEDVKIFGDVALNKGLIKNNSIAPAIANDETEYVGEIIDSSSHVWEAIPLDYSNLFLWTDSAQVRYRAASKASDYFDDVMISDREIVRRDKIIIERDAVLKNTEIYAESIEIKENAVLENCLVFGRSITIEGEAQLGGKIVVTDSLSVNLSEKQKNKVEFYNSGANINSVFDIINFTGDAYFYYGGKRNSIGSLKPNVYFSDSVSIKGMVIVKGSLDFSGSIEGGIIAERLLYNRDGSSLKDVINKAEVIYDSLAWKRLPVLFSKKIEIKYEKQ